MGLLKKVREGDWVTVNRNFQLISSTKLGPIAIPTFASLKLTDLTVSRLVATNASKVFVSSDLANWVAGTANQITVTDDSDGTITLSTPQDIHISATPTFNTITATNKFKLGGGAYIEYDSESGNIPLKLGDNAGSNKLSITDSDNAEVAYIDSNGNFSLAGFITTSVVDIALKLSEALGVSAVSIKDSDNAEVAYINSDGGIWSAQFSTQLGAVVYADSANGLLTADTEILSVDESNARLGINKATPAVTLDVDGAITSSTIITGEQLTSTDDITMAGLFTNTPTAGDASVILINGDTNARTYDGGAESTMSFLRTITGSGSDRPTDVNLVYSYITMGYDFTGDVTNVAKYIRSMANRIDYTGDWKITAEAGFLNNNPVHIRALDNLATTQPGNLLQMTVAKDMTVSLYGSNNEALLQSDFDIQAGTITANVYGGKFKGWGGATLNITSGVPIINYYGGYFEAVGTVDGTSTAYGGYFTASGADTNYGIYVAAGVALFKEKILLVQTDGNEFISSLSDGYVDYGATTAHRFNNDISFTTSKGIRQGTSDASDNQSTYLAGGGAFGNTRGACLVCYGNEVGEAPGRLYLYGGNVTNGDIICNVENSERLRVKAEGILVTGAVVSGQLVVTSANHGTVAVGSINSIVVDSETGQAVTINDFTGGVAGQIIEIMVRDNTTATTITDQSGSNQEIFLHDAGNNLIIEAGTRGGCNLVCDGSNWYDSSHAKHV